MSQKDEIQQFQIRAKVTRSVIVIVEARNRTEAMNKFEAMDWVAETPSETLDWEAEGEPEDY